MCSSDLISKFVETVDTTVSKSENVKATLTTITLIKNNEFD